ncbi:low molecular weight phosphatase family protein [Lichenibacterium ramalinae]|uniref:Low molecular weight phosphatase family protein n=1 Tax=Lichenibacterium ramalinae TaxID=2316527 RepID=A0A4V1RHZ8_9HYPH|nr:low molecular weight phosphatase family protein [Lichenibacterium ramalinae]RYB01797.1 low molecular weight phosphatase family protein [Lichenibacterium ramalinae]
MTPTAAPGFETPPGAPRARPQSILFACSENAVRSVMAETLAKRIVGRSVYIQSAGVRPGVHDPFVDAVMDELGFDTARHRPRRFEDLEDDNFDLIVTLSPEAHHRALEYTRAMAVDVTYWPTADPTATEGSRDSVLAAYRATREGLARRIKALLDWRPIGSV